MFNLGICGPTTSFRAYYLLEKSSGSIWIHFHDYHGYNNYFYGRCKLAHINIHFSDSWTYFTKYKHQYKKEIGVYEGTRTLKNVISNGIVPFVMAAFGNYGGFIGSIATATADTMASEVGVTQQPRLITTLKKVPPGTDGGISVVGTAAGIIGAGIIGVAAYLLGIFPIPL